MTNNRRIIQHTDNHYDIEEYKPVLNELGEPFGYVWAVIYCSEDEMNGYTKGVDLETRIKNLLSQVPEEYRTKAILECYAGYDNVHDFERKLIGYVLNRTWETYDHPVNEAEFVDGFCDPRTPEEKEADLFAQEVEYTRLKDWDVTPTPNMPIIDFDNIDEIPF